MTALAGDPKRLPGRTNGRAHGRKRCTHAGPSARKRAARGDGGIKADRIRLPMNDEVLIWFARLFAKSLELSETTKELFEIAQATSSPLSKREREVRPLAEAPGLPSAFTGAPAAPFAGEQPGVAPSTASADFAEFLLHRCIAIIDNAGAPSSAARNQSLKSAVRSMAEHPFRLHTVASLASSAGMSRSTFAKSFRDAFGEGPVRFLTLERLRVAKHLLQTTPLPVKEIVGKVGYTSPSYFARAIRAEFGQTPTQLRERRDQVDAGAPQGGDIGPVVTSQAEAIAGTTPEASQITAYEVFDGIPSCVKVLDLAANILFFNRHGLYVMELDSLAQIHGKPWVSLWPEDGRPDVQAAVDKALCGNIGECPVSARPPKARRDGGTFSSCPSRSNGLVELVVISRELLPTHIEYLRRELPRNQWKPHPGYEGVGSVRVRASESPAAAYRRRSRRDSTPRPRKNCTTWSRSAS